MSDREAVERFSYDVRWKYACGVSLEFPAFQHTVLVDMRARLRNSDSPNRIFETVLGVAKKAGLVGRKRVLDSTALYDAVATQDTVTMIRSAIRGLLRTSDAMLGEEIRASLRRDDDYATAGKPAWTEGPLQRSIKRYAPAMWVRRAAIRAVPLYARVATTTLERMEQLLSGEESESEERLEEAFRRFERTQPALSSRIAGALARPAGETALALGYFLSLAVWLAFEESFGARLEEVSEESVEATTQALAFDEELRKSAPEEAVETDDVVAMEQPEVLLFVRDHIDVALEATTDSQDVEEVGRIYKLVLMEIIALSYAVAPPDQYPVRKAEWSA